MITLISQIYRWLIVDRLQSNQQPSQNIIHFIQTIPGCTEKIYRELEQNAKNAALAGKNATETSTKDIFKEFLDKILDANESCMPWWTLFDADFSLAVGILGQVKPIRDVFLMFRSVYCCRFLSNWSSSRAVWRLTMMPILIWRTRCLLINLCFICLFELRFVDADTIQWNSCWIHHFSSFLFHKFIFFLTGDCNKKGWVKGHCLMKSPIISWITFWNSPANQPIFQTTVLYMIQNSSQQRLFTRTLLNDHPSSPNSPFLLYLLLHRR